MITEGSGEDHTCLTWATVDDLEHNTSSSTGLPQLSFVVDGT